MQKCERRLFCLCGAHSTFSHARGQARLAVLPCVPVIHARQHRIALVDGKYRAFDLFVEIGIGDDGGYLDDAIVLRFQPVISRSIQTRLVAAYCMTELRSWTRTAWRA